MNVPYESPLVSRASEIAAPTRHDGTVAVLVVEPDAFASGAWSASNRFDSVNALRMSRVDGYETARAFLRAQPVDAVLVSFPATSDDDMDGLFFLRKECPGVALVAVFHGAGTDRHVRAVQMGADDSLEADGLDAGALISAVLKIEARRRRADAARGIELRGSSLIAAMADGIFVAQGQRFVHANTALVELLGYTHDEFVGLPFDKVIAAEFLDTFRERFERRMGDGPEPPRRYDVQCLRKDGKPVWIEVRASRAEFDGQRAVLGVARDISDRRQSEELARREVALRTRLSQVLSTIPGAVYSFRMDTEGRFSFPFASEGMASLYGISPDLVRDDAGPAMAMVHPDDAETLRRSFEVSARGMSVWQGRFRLRHPDRGELWIEGRSSPQREPDGSIVWHGYMQDVSDHMRSDERFRQVVESAPYGMVMVDGRGTIVLANREVARLFDYPVEALLGRPVEMLLPERVRDGHATHRERFRAQPEKRGMAVESELFGRRSDGRDIPLQIGLNPIATAEGPMVLATVIDISEKKLMDAELEWHRHHLEELVNERTDQLVIANRTLAKREQFIRTVTDAVPGLVSYWDRDWRCRFANATYEKWFGFPVGTMVGARFPELIGEDIAARLRPHVEAVLRGEPQRFRSEVKHVDGSVADIEVYYIPDEVDGQIPGYYVLVIDVTAETRAQRQLAEANAGLASQAEAAQAATRAKSAFLANMSHEIRTPMNAILGVSELMRRGQLSGRQSQQLDKIHAAALHLLEIINSILDLSKIEAGKLTLEHGEIQIGEMLSGVTSMLFDRAAAKGLVISVESDPFPGVLVGDRTRLAQALLNYGSNAVKFTERGSVVLRARRVAEDERTVLIRFEVQDSGIGIAPDVLPRLFTVFEQADVSTTRRYGGTGLGLAINRRLAEMMDGEAGATSSEGLGSTFWFTARLEKSALGAAKGTASRAEPAEAVLRRVHAGTRVLLAEDDEINQEVATEFLREAGLVADVAPNGLAAVEMTCANDYALVLMDMQMPDMDGLEATREIRSRLGERAPPIVAMTANAFAEDRIRCAEVGMVDFVAKPFDPDDLFAVVLKSLSARAA